MLYAALKYVDQPNYSAYIFVPTYEYLVWPGNIWERMIRWTENTDAEVYELTKTIRFPSGAKVTFGYISEWEHYYRYNWVNAHFIGINEPLKCDERAASALQARLRKSEPDSIPLRFRTVGHDMWMDSWPNWKDVPNG